MSSNQFPSQGNQQYGNQFPSQGNQQYSNQFPSQGNQQYSNQFPAQSNQFPSQSNQFPSQGSQQYSNQFPAQSNQFPNQQPQYSNQFPSQSNQFPSQGSQQYSNQFPAQSNQFPSQSNQFPAQSNQFPSQSNQFPAQSNQFPSQGSQQYSNQFPSQSNQFPNQQQPQPQPYYPPPQQPQPQQPYYPPPQQPQQQPYYPPQQPQPPPGAGQEMMVEYQNVATKLSMNLLQVPGLYWQTDFINSLASTSTFEEVRRAFLGTAWDYIRFYHALYTLSKDNRFTKKNKEECHRRLMILVAVFTDKFLPSNIDSNGNFVVDQRTNFVIQFQRQATQNGGSLMISALKNVSYIPAPLVPCGKTTKYTEIRRPPNQPRHQSTFVHILYSDTVDATLEIITKSSDVNQRVAVLNMTHPRRPGGSWKKGDISQEETLFLRTGLSRALNSDDYPLETFTCLYTRDVRVIRMGPLNGYSFIKSNSKYNVAFDVISMAGIDASTKKGNNAQNAFTEKEAATLRVKFELLLNTCANNNADVLVLGAIGCGAFENPPDAVAQAFRSVIDIYAGYFSNIYFVIFDTQIANVFAGELIGRGKVCDPDRDTAQSCPTQVYPRVFGVLPEPTDMTKPICEEGGNCESLDNDHYLRYSHPPFCHSDSCPSMQNSQIPGAAHHCFNFMHKVPCPMGGRCIKHDDPSHSRRFSHPERCEYWANCTIQDRDHMQKYLHPPLCPRGHLCQQKGDANHMANFRHASLQCPDDHFCRNIHNAEHMDTYSHSFLPPCEKSPYDCNDTSKTHLATYSHLCRYGPSCKELRNPEHTKFFYHAAVECRYGSSCKDFTEEHLQTYWHPNASPPARKVCRVPWCTDTRPEHRREYYHLPTHLALSPVDMLNCRDPGNEEAYGDFSQTAGARVPFFSNVSQWLQKLKDYIGDNLSTKSQNYVEIKNWFENLRPMHMCSANTVISMCKTGAMFSAKKIQALWENRKDVIECVFNRETTRRLVGDDPERKKRLKKYGTKYVRMVQARISKERVPKLLSNGNDKSQAIAIYQKTDIPNQDKEQERCQDRSACASVYGDMLIRNLEAEIEDVVNAIANLIDEAPGINHGSDAIMRTNHIVFSIVGPHYYNYGNTEVVFVMRKTIMWHPDFYMTPGAATSYRTQRYHMGREPWMGPSKTADGGAMNDYFTEKFSLVDPRWSDAAAMDFICRTLNVEFKKPIEEASTVNLNMLRLYWEKVNAHAVIEGHLPSYVPLDYVEHVIIQRSAYDKIMADPIAKTQFEAWEKKYGKQFIEVVNSARDVNVANDKYLLRTKPIYDPNGFSFAIYGKREQFMPIKFKDDERKIYIYFMASGGKFSISVSNIGDLSDKKIKRMIATFTVDGAAMGVSACFLQPLAALTAKKEGEMPDFNRGCPTSKYVHYLLCVDHDASTLTLKHWGASTLYNDKEFTIKFRRDIVYSHFSFASSVDVEEPPSIWGLSVEYKERPRTVAPMPSASDIQSRSVELQSRRQQQQQQLYSNGYPQSYQSQSQQSPAWGGFPQQNSWQDAQQSGKPSNSSSHGSTVAWGQQQSTPTWGNGGNGGQSQQTWGNSQSSWGQSQQSWGNGQWN